MLDTDAVTCLNLHVASRRAVRPKAGRPVTSPNNVKTPAPLPWPGVVAVTPGGADMAKPRFPGARSTGSLLSRDTADESNEARFGKRVTVMPNGCWAYNGDLTRYHRFRTSAGDELPAHRFTYQTFHGAIPDGEVVHHECRNPGCVNPSHLLALTHKGHQIIHDL